MPVFVMPGGVLDYRDASMWADDAYMPDLSIPLNLKVLSASAASLLFGRSARRVRVEHDTGSRRRRHVQLNQFHESQERRPI